MTGRFGKDTKESGRRFAGGSSRERSATPERPEARCDPCGSTGFLSFHYVREAPVPNLFKNKGGLTASVGEAVAACWCPIGDWRCELADRCGKPIKRYRDVESELIDLTITSAVDLRQFNRNMYQELCRRIGKPYLVVEVLEDGTTKGVWHDPKEETRRQGAEDQR